MKLILLALSIPVIAAAYQSSIPTTIVTKDGTMTVLSSNWVRTMSDPPLGTKFHYSFTGSPVKASFKSSKEALVRDLSAPKVEADTRSVTDPKTKKKGTEIVSAHLTGGVSGTQTRDGVTISVQSDSAKATGQSHLELDGSVVIDQKDPKSSNFNITGSHGTVDTMADGTANGKLDGPVTFKLHNQPEKGDPSDFDGSCDHATFTVDKSGGQVVMHGNVQTHGTDPANDITGGAEIMTITFKKIAGKYVVTQIESGVGTGHLESKP
jgi:hypothetical protein